MRPWAYLPANDSGEGVKLLRRRSLAKNESSTQQGVNRGEGFQSYSFSTAERLDAVESTALGRSGSHVRYIVLIATLSASNVGIDVAVMVLRLFTLVALLHGSLLFTFCQALYRCKCNTEECKLDQTSTCYAEHYCYAEYFNNNLIRGCIDSPTPLNCGNRKPANLPNTAWPITYCCNEKDYCNKDVFPTLPPNTEEDETVTEKTEEEENKPVPVLCPNSETDPMYRSNTEGTKIINPIYIAVPVAGVCVLLALIIFAMYLLRRRTDYYEGYHYHEHVPSLQQKQSDGKKAAPTMCSTCGKVNRCTDSERSSSGSETKLFLQV